MPGCSDCWNAAASPTCSVASPCGEWRRASHCLRRQRRVFARNAADIFHVNWLPERTGPRPRDRRPALVTVLGTDMQLLRLPGMRALLRRACAATRSPSAPTRTGCCRNCRPRSAISQRSGCVPFGIDSRWYAVERRSRGEPGAEMAVRFAAHRGQDQDAVRLTEPAFAHGQAELHLFGPMQEQVELPAWVHWHGLASPDALRETWFPQAHGLVTLSRHAEGRRR